MNDFPIIFLKNKQIDRIKWDRCVENSCNGTLYALSWYLDAVAENWDALIAGDYDIIFPITYVKKFKINILYTPDCIQQLGIFSKDLLSEDILVRFLKAIPKKFLFGKLNLNSGNAFSGDTGFQIAMKVNIEQDISLQINLLRQSYGRNITENLRKTRKNNITVRKSDNFRNTIEAYRANRGKERYYTGEKYYESAYKLSEVLAEKKLLIVHEACTEKGDFLAGITAVPFKNRIVLSMLGCLPEGYRVGATSLLVDSILERFSEQKEICDFEGSNTESVANFYLGFGGHIVPYPEVSIENIPKSLIRIIFKMKRIVTGKKTSWDWEGD